MLTPNNAAERGRADADRERDARAVDDAAPDVAAEESVPIQCRAPGCSSACAESTLSGS